ncbi:putative n-carbamoyl-d-amino acid hydrolase [Phaeomoniella chlamydospora]|uniref:Putative n-carbamoyl-d-amino acid hydrolase n=1 Tax=Phaeomoniella chlamydospora TaxID=158046 RepID=A0A0G2E0K9_PHACM|nr:putative n-carbamoyl-d-amino acid hydrolase [Phaeomoniella chlamydospora]
MPRNIVVAGAQMGAVDTTTPRTEVLDRMIKLLSEAQSKGAKLVVYPECAFTTFFPRHLITNKDDLEKWFEHDVNGDPTLAPNMKPLFDKAREYGIDISVGYAEHDTSRPEEEHVHYNTAVYFSAAAGKIVSKYRKVHLPGTVEPYATPGATQQLEKRYFRPGNLGFEAFRAPGLLPDAAKKPQANGTVNGDSPIPSHAYGTGDPIVGTLICNDRRWAEAWRCYGLQGVEVVLCGYNTTGWAPDLLGTNKKIKTKEDAYNEALSHNQLSMQHGSYTNACFSIAVARCGMDDGKYPLIGGSCIVDPDGDVIAKAKTMDQDELIVAEIDLDDCKRGKGKVFAFERHRRPEAYGRMVYQTGVVEPPLLS